MHNRFVRALLALSIGAALSHGAAFAKVSKDQSKKVATKTIATKKSDSPSKDAAARRARIKKMKSAAPKEARKGSQPAKPTKQVQAAQVASKADGGSIEERRARIHTMRVPE
jgi:hypothetical protein